MPWTRRFLNANPVFLIGPGPRSRSSLSMVHPMFIVLEYVSNNATAYVSASADDYNEVLTLDLLFLPLSVRLASRKTI
jgi:hypothetical protein